jgi:hypothetical protein
MNFNGQERVVVKLLPSQLVHFVWRSWTSFTCTARNTNDTAIWMREKNYNIKFLDILCL